MVLHCHAPGWKTWYVSETAPREKLYIVDPEVVVDALVHCIDRTSGREAVHDPDVEHELATQRVPFQKRAWRTGCEEVADAEWTAKEQERRRAAKMMVKIYEPVSVDDVLGSC